MFSPQEKSVENLKKHWISGDIGGLLNCDNPATGKSNNIGLYEQD